MQTDDDDAGLWYFGFCAALTTALAVMTAPMWWFFYEVTR